MNKIICDICGTDYPETAAQCPICGCASAGAQTSAGNDVADAEEKAYTPVKGGRYSKANVRKRLKANQIPYDPIPDSDPEPEYEDDENQEEVEEEEDRDQGSNRGLIILVGILLVAIIAVASYIAVSMFDIGIDLDKLPIFNNKVTTTQATVGTDPTTDPTAESTTVSTDVACTELDVSDVDIFLKEVGSTWQLTVNPVPAETTDQLVFASSDEAVVTVDQTGLVTAVGTGKASVIITCGNVVVDCPVLCGEDPDATEATEPEEPEDSEQTASYSVLVNGRVSPFGDEHNAEVTIAVGEEFRLTVENGEGVRQTVEWNASKEGICSVDGRTITGQSAGKVTLSTTIDGQTLKCIIIVK